MDEPSFDQTRPARSNSIWSTATDHAGRAYNIIASPPFEFLAKALESRAPQRFAYRPTKWGKFKDSQMDDIELGGYAPYNVIRGSNILFLASFDTNDAILSQFQALVALSESFIASLTVILPFYPTGTMERLDQRHPGQVATASTIARLFSTLPPTAGGPTRVMIFDVHTLQNKFYFFGHAIADLFSCIPLLLTRTNAYIGPVETASEETKNPACLFDAIAFPDEGAGKRFGTYFPGYEKIICGKQRIGDQRLVTIHDGDPKGKRVLIVDDMIRSGGTITESAKVIKSAGATEVLAFCTHAAGLLEDLKKFLPGGPKHGVFTKFYLTNSVPNTVGAIPENDVFEVLDILSLVANSV